jgi:hypothetical protein
MVDIDQSNPTSTGFSTVPVSDLIESRSQDELQAFLESFKCSKNEDVQTFLHKNAVLVEKADKGRTYLLATTVSSEDPDMEYDVAAYFTLALKHVELSNLVSRTTKKKLNGLSMPDGDPPIVVGYLIGQLGKNDCFSEDVPGSVVLEAALNKIDEAQAKVGGRFVIVECEQHPKLLDFYKDNGFFYLQDGPTDKMAQLYLLF